MEFDETPRFWYPRIALNAWTDFAFCSYENLWFDFCKSYREVEAPFSFLSLLVSSHLFSTFSLSLIPIKFSWFAPFSFISPSFLSFLLLFFHYSPALPSFVCSHSFFSFSLYFIFLLSFIFFSSFSPPFLLLLPVLIKSGGNFPPLCYLATCHLYNFLYFFFFLSLSYT